MSEDLLFILARMFFEPGYITFPLQSRNELGICPMLKVYPI